MSSRRARLGQLSHVLGRSLSRAWMAFTEARRRLSARVHPATWCRGLGKIRAISISASWRLGRIHVVAVCDVGR